MSTGVLVEAPLASGAPAAAYIDGEMWTAFRSSAPLAVDPVSFLYADYGESLTIWTNSF